MWTHSLRLNRTAPERDWSASRITPAGRSRPATLACILSLLLTGGISADLCRGAAQPQAARSVRVGLAEKESALRARLRGDPGDDLARLNLSGLLLEYALEEAHESDPAWTEPGSPGCPPYKEHLAGVLPASTAFAEARRLAEEVAAQGRDRRVRARAWFRLSRVEYYLGNPHGQVACMEAAMREDPATWPIRCSDARSGNAPASRS
jgi:hypothetical protein